MKFGVRLNSYLQEAILDLPIGKPQGITLSALIVIPKGKVTRPIKQRNGIGIFMAIVRQIIHVSIQSVVSEAVGIQLDFPHSPHQESGGAGGKFSIDTYFPSNKESTLGLAPFIYRYPKA